MTKEDLPVTKEVETPKDMMVTKIDEEILSTTGDRATSSSFVDKLP